MNNKKFIVVEVSGSYKDVGNSIGEYFKKEIQANIKTRKRKIPNYTKYLEKTKAYYDLTKDTFPNLIAESDAIASSADVSISDYFFMNTREVYDIAEEYDKKQAANPDHCTIAVSFNGGAVVGHNEDWSKEAKDSLYILKATIGDVSFTTLNYKPAISGVAAAMNSYGLVQCINDLYQTTQFGVPKNYLARAVLECRSLDEAEALIRSTKRASGFNHVLVQGMQVRNVEIAADEISVQKLIDKSYVHTNHYLSPEMKMLEKFHTKSSEARYKRAVSLVKNGMSFEDMKELLSDTGNKEFPICRSDDTIGSVIALPEKGEFWASYGHPCSNNYLSY